MTKKVPRFHLAGGKLHEADDGELVRYVDVARFLPGFDRGREHPDTWVPHEPTLPLTGASWYAPDGTLRLWHYPQPLPDDAPESLRVRSGEFGFPVNRPAEPR